MMKSILASIVFLSACGTIGVLGCSPASLFQGKKPNPSSGCAFSQRLRQICDGNPNNDYYTKEELEAIAKTSKNETRNGIDIKCAPGSSVYSPLRGRITHLDENTITMDGLRTFNGFIIKMTNVQVSSSLTVNSTVFAREYIGKKTIPRLEDDQEVKAVSIDLEMFNIKKEPLNPSWFVCPVVEWHDGSRVFFNSNGRPIKIDHDKCHEELQQKILDDEESDEGSGSGEREPRKNPCNYNEK